MKVFINNNARFWIILTQILLEECKYAQEKLKIENRIDEDLEKSESGSDSNDETESDIDCDEYGKWFVETILIIIMPTSFGLALPN